MSLPNILSLGIVEVTSKEERDGRFFIATAYLPVARIMSVHAENSFFYKDVEVKRMDAWTSFLYAAEQAESHASAYGISNVSEAEIRTGVVATEESVVLQRPDRYSSFPQERCMDNREDRKIVEALRKMNGHETVRHEYPLAWSSRMPPEESTKMRKQIITLVERGVPSHKRMEDIKALFDELDELLSKIRQNGGCG